MNPGFFFHALKMRINRNCKGIQAAATCNRAAGDIAGLRAGPLSRKRAQSAPASARSANYLPDDRGTPIPGNLPAMIVSPASRDTRPASLDCEPGLLAGTICPTFGVADQGRNSFASVRRCYACPCTS